MIRAVKSNVLDNREQLVFRGGTLYFNRKFLVILPQNLSTDGTGVLARTFLSVSAVMLCIEWDVVFN